MSTKRILLSLILLFGGFALAHASTAGKIRSGNKYFNKGEYDKSLDRYREAQIASPDNPVVYFNMGDSLHKLGQFDEAAKAYQRSAASTNKIIQSRAYYNMGNNAYRQEKPDEALEYYKKALLLNPNDEDAKYNYEFLLKQKQQPKSKDKKNDKQKQQQGQGARDKGQGNDKDKNKENNKNQQGQSEQNKQGMSKEDAQRILQVYDEADKESARKRKMQTPQLPKVDEDW